MDLFTLVAKIALDASDYETKIANVISSAQEAGAQIDAGLSGGKSSGGVGTTFGQATQSVSSFGTTVKSILAAGYIQRGLDLVTNAGKKSVEAASDLVEVQNVVDTTFGSSADQIDRWAKTQAGAYGLSELQAKQFSGYLGSMLQTSGIGQAESAEMAMNLSELAGDLASFYNVGIEEAYKKLQSGLAGEREPLLRYGLDLGADSVGAFAGTELKDLDNAERFQARYDYLMEHTRTIQGDYMRTSDELANSQRTLENNLTRLSASFGEKLMPIMKAGTNAANDLFAALYSETAEQSLANIDATAKSASENLSGTAEKARTMVSVLEDYGDKASLSSDQQAQWNAVAGELIRSIPELSGLIDLQTGNIDGGTAALYENIAAWEESGRVAADTSALEAKRDMLSGLSAEIANEQGLLAIAEKELSQQSDGVAAIGAAVAQQLGTEFDGTAESFRTMMDSVAAYGAAEKLGFTDEDIASALSSYDQASQKAEEHKEKIAELQTEYDTVQTAITESASSMETSVSDSFSGIQTATNELISGFDQSDSAYANAYSTGMGAANGLAAAYPSYAAAASLYSSGRLGGGLGALESTAHLPGHATGLDYVPYDNYVARLHEGEAVLTKSEATGWRQGGSGTISAQDIASAVVQAVSPLYEAISSIRIVMDSRAVGDAVTETVSRNIARDAHNRRYHRF